MSRRTSAILLACCFAAFAAPAAGAATPIPGQYVIVLKQSADQRAVVADHRRSAHAHVLASYGHALKGYAARLSDADLKKVKSDPRVDYVVPDMEGRPAQAQTLPPGINRVDADLSTALAGNGSGATDADIAVVDSGIDTDHPDLNVVGGVNCLSASDTLNDGTIEDRFGHGTHVAGIAAAKDDVNGIVGVAPGARLWSVRVLNAGGGGTFASQLCGVDWVTAHAPANGGSIRVANFSMVSLLTRSDDGNCGNSNNDPLHQAICRSAVAGVTWSMAAGNAAVDLSGHYAAAPMAYDEVLTSTAMNDNDGRPGSLGGAMACRKKNTGDTDDRYASFSNWVSSAADQAHTVATPGTCVNSTWPGGGYSVQSGTSMSAPVTAGTVALCLASGECGAIDPLLGTLLPFTPPQIIQKMVGDSRTYNVANPSFGYTGDPLHSPVAGRHYGYLLRAGEY
jgi:subtilisin